MVKVKVYATLQEIAGVEYEEVPAGTVGEALVGLTDRHPALVQEIYSDDSRSSLLDKVKVMVNGRNVDFLDGLETPIGAGDRLAVFPLIAGG
ncbi:MAG: ubiquitin-like small modifier protein 1 [Methanomassiliicoccales archaeon]